MTAWIYFVWHSLVSFSSPKHVVDAIEM